MFPRILKRMREMIRTCLYIMTVHAAEEMSNDGLTIYDIECVVLTGEISERQKDRQTGEWKYRFCGSALKGKNVEVIAKLSPTAKWLLLPCIRHKGENHEM